MEKQITPYLCNTVNVYPTPLPFYATQTISPFLNFIISANHEKESNSANSVILIPLTVSLALISFRLTKVFKCSRLYCLLVYNVVFMILSPIKILLYIFDWLMFNNHNNNFIEFVVARDVFFK